MSDTEQLWREIEKINRTLERVRTSEGGTIAGTWTPTLAGSGGGGSFTYSIRAGRYKRVGPMVFAPFTITLATFTSAPAGNLQITGLPYTAVSGNPSGGVIIVYTNAALSAITRGQVTQATSVCNFYDSSGVAIAASVVSLALNFQGVAVYEAV